MVTGGCGFIGSEITKQLSSIGARVTVFDNLSSGKEEYIEGLPNVQLIKGDLTDEGSVKSAVRKQGIHNTSRRITLYSGLLSLSKGLF